MTPPPIRRPLAVAFDIIDTTFRIEALDGPLVGLGLPSGLVRRLYAEALRDAMALACAGRFAPFADVMRTNLSLLLVEHGLAPGDAAIGEALGFMRRLPPHPDAAEAYASLASAGIRVMALSNGAEAATRALFDAAGMAGSVTDVLSVESVALAKPRPEVYRHALAVAGIEPDALMLVACHPWDIQGAQAVGLLGGYVARGRPYPAFMPAPDLAADGLLSLARAIVALPA